MAAVDINRGTTGVVLPTTFAREIWQGIQEKSGVLALTEGLDLPGTGLTIDMITGDPTPTWVGETEEVAVSRGTVSTDLMTPYTLSVVVPFSNKFRRDKRALYNALANRLPLVLAKKIDLDVLTGASPGTNFDVLSAAAVVNLNAAAGTYTDVDDGVENARAAIAGSIDGLDPNATIYSPRMMTVLRKCKDQNGKPKFYDNVQTGTITHVASTTLVKSLSAVEVNTPDATHDVVGMMGDWSYAKHGIVENITLSMSDQATLTEGASTINLWQRRMFALMVEIELGFVVRDILAFRRLAETTAA